MIFMQLLEAAKLLVEIIEECVTLNGSSIFFMPPKPQITLSDGYKIHITKSVEIDKETLSCIENIVKKNNLAYIEDKDGMMIYRKR